jgi:hypothetical protein
MQAADLHPFLDEMVLDVFPDEGEAYELHKDVVVASAMSSSATRLDHGFRGDHEFAAADVGVCLAAINLAVASVRFVQELLAEREMRREDVRTRWQGRLVEGGVAPETAADVAARYSGRLAELAGRARHG